MRSVPEKEVHSHKTENTVADSGSEEASMEDLEGPISTMDCMMREKETTEPSTTMAATASQPRRGS